MNPRMPQNRKAITVRSISRSPSIPKLLGHLTPMPDLDALILFQSWSGQTVVLVVEQFEFESEFRYQLTKPFGSQSASVGEPGNAIVCQNAVSSGLSSGS